MADPYFNIPAGTAYLRGKVLHNGRPTHSAFVSMGPHKFRTGRDGKYELPGVESGHWTVAVWYNYRNYLQRIKLMPGPNNYNFEIEYLYALYGEDEYV